MNRFFYLSKFLQEDSYVLDTFGKFASARFVDHPIFIVGGSRSGTIALLKAIGKCRRILSAPTEDPFITNVGRMAMQLELFSNQEKDYYLRTLRISEEHIHKSLRRLALESAFGPHYGFKQLMKSAVNEKVNPLAKRYWCTKSVPVALPPITTGVGNRNHYSRIFAVTPCKFWAIASTIDWISDFMRHSTKDVEKIFRRFNSVRHLEQFCVGKLACSIPEAFRRKGSSCVTSPS